MERQDGFDRVALRGQRGPILSAAFSPRGDRIATAGQDGAVWVWETAAGGELLVLRHPAAVRSVGFSPTGQWVVTGCDDGKTRVWQSTGKTAR